MIVQKAPVTKQEKSLQKTGLLSSSLFIRSFALALCLVVAY
uniref:Uncharacterized protein n=1 Tax=Coprothermobacter proteolyticus (strain ATCC 35245 / DSM 5265 / OCM 4 / BT) TaxID=309798 RepID=B5Y6S4_COPPD